MPRREFRYTHPMPLKSCFRALLAIGIFAFAARAQSPAMLPNLFTSYVQSVVKSYTQTCDSSGCHNQTGDPLIAALSNTGDGDTKIDDAGSLLFNGGAADSNGNTYATGLYLLHTDGTTQPFADAFPAATCIQPNSNTATVSGAQLVRIYFNSSAKAFYAVTVSSQTTYNFSKSNSGVCTSGTVNGTYTTSTATAFALVRIDKAPQ